MTEPFFKVLIESFDHIGSYRTFKESLECQELVFPPLDGYDDVKGDWIILVVFVDTVEPLVEVIGRAFLREEKTY